MLALAGKRGFSLIELIIATVILVSAASITFTLYKRSENIRRINEKRELFEALVMKLETAKTKYGNAFPAGSLSDLSNISGNTNIERLLRTTGFNGSPYSGWAYSCSGSTLTIQIYTRDLPGSHAKETLRKSIERGNPGWTCVIDSNENTLCSRSVACR